MPLCARLMLSETHVRHVLRTNFTLKGGDLLDFQNLLSLKRIQSSLVHVQYINHDNEATWRLIVKVNWVL